jgi:5'-nucleotidase
MVAPDQRPSERRGNSVKRIIRAAILCALALLVVVPTVATAKPTATTCTDTLAPGVYRSVVVPDGAVCIIDSGPLTILGGLTVGEGATFVLGSQETPDVTSVIAGGVHATNAASVQIHFSTISGGIDIHGGAGPFGGPFDVTWNTIEDSVINGRVTIEGYNGFWMGFIRNTVNGPVNLNDNVLADPDGNEYVTNTINGPLSCAGNDPAPQVGDSEGMLNRVSGPATGQCADLA